MIRLLTDADLRLRLSKNAREYVEQNFSFKKIAKEFEDICMNTLNNNLEM
jgi:glycosyltransferase involved in cell wall biosynthesis